MSDQCPLCSRSDCRCVAIATRLTGCWLRAGKSPAAAVLPTVARPPFPFIDGPAKSLVALAGPGGILDGVQAPSGRTL